MSKRKILSGLGLAKDAQKLLDLLSKEGDLPVILIATNYLDACLGSILKIQLINSSVSKKLLQDRGVLGTFSARSDACYALGLIGKPMYEDLAKIGEIRNIVAHHHLALTFTDADVSRLCEKLRYVEFLEDEGKAKPLLLSEFRRGARNRFVWTTIAISSMLLQTLAKLPFKRPPV